ncbi:unnamed protein product [Allacma fusca]|uniref:Uncharacterized protein n=1 Tax=Allacma fusca TaxID=39272 RepID=A0A8J2KC53_9HEXA|nr:unnamed protein product [Allacma fusca]
MSIYFAGTDQFEILSREKRCNSFTPLQSDFTFEDCVLDWDLVLYSSNTRGFKSWFIKGIISKNCSLQIHPSEKYSGVGPSKGVIAGDKVYILDQSNFQLYFVSIPHIVEKYLTENLLEFSMERVVFSEEIEPKILDISTCGKECFAIDSLGGIYAIPKLWCRMEGLQWSGIYSGYAFSLLRTDTGAVYSWGNGSRGELACGGWHSLALTSDGDIYSWGWNEAGSAEDPVEKISVGARHSVAVLKSGKVFSWGSNKFGQLGLGDCENRAIPTQVNIPSVSRVHCGRWATLILTV